MTKATTVNIQVKPVILCGGSGTRLWPVSTKVRPKQFQALISDHSMLTETLKRVSDHNFPDLFQTGTVIGALGHKERIEKTLTDQRLILEPFGRDSAGAVALACLTSRPDDIIIILPADHAIEDVTAFHRAIEQSLDKALSGQIITFGIEPTYPATGYGYIEAKPEGNSPFQCERFVEKPNKATAETYISTGKYYWNAGIFLFKNEIMLKALEQYAPDVIKHTKAAVFGQNLDQLVIPNSREFAQAPAISIDYAVMEPISQKGGISVTPVSMGWSDIGDFSALHEFWTKDGEKDVNLVQRGPVCAQDTHNSYIHSEGPFLGVIGLENVAIVATDEGVLACDLKQTQTVKNIASYPKCYGYGGLLPGEVKSHIQNWLFKVLDYWAEESWDEVHGGFKEALTLADRKSEALEYRRMRVQARQIYSFAHAHLLGWQGPAQTLVNQGLSYMFETCWRNDEGFCHRFTPDGKILDARMDTYDHAFALTALAWVHRAGLGQNLQEKAEKIIELLDQKLSGPNGGYYDDNVGTCDRRANPHMHLLEAHLALYESFKDPIFLSYAKKIVNLFEVYFFDPIHDRVIEYFNEDWSHHGERHHITEPGHAYEWASLLAKYQMLSGHDLTSWRRRLISAADRFGTCPETGLVMNTITPTGKPLSSISRLWPQTEKLRAHLVHPTSNFQTMIPSLIKSLLNTYFKDAGEHVWMDAYTLKGDPSAENIPASSLYHILSAFSPLLDGNQA